MDVGAVWYQGSGKGFGNMDQLVNEHPFLIVRGQPVKFFSQDLQTVVSRDGQRLLPDSG